MSFGERLSTRLFAAHLNAQGVPAKQYDAYAMGVTTSDNFVNAEVSQCRVQGQGCCCGGAVDSWQHAACLSCWLHSDWPRLNSAMPCCAVPAVLCCAPLCPQVNYELTLPAVKESLTFGPGQQRHLPIVTGFLGRGLQTGAITTLGRGGSDLSCTLIGAALGLPEVQVRGWGGRAGGWVGRPGKEVGLRSWGGRMHQNTPDCLAAAPSRQRQTHTPH